MKVTCSPETSAEFLWANGVITQNSACNEGVHGCFKNNFADIHKMFRMEEQFI